MSFVALSEYEIMAKKYREMRRKFKKQVKVIQLMSDYLAINDVNGYTGENLWKNSEEAKQHFFDKVKDSEVEDE